jgi:hypothetical protein
MKLAHYHRARGDAVHFSKRTERQRGEPTYGRVYGSAIFGFSADRGFAAWPSVTFDRSL